MCSSHINDGTEIRTDCIISGLLCPWQRMRIKKVTVDKSWFYEDDSVIKR
jgi:hypothetical protein